MRRILPCCLALALLFGCGGEEETATPRPGVGTSLDGDNLAVVHDELYACLQAELPDALLANHLGGQASITSAYGRSSFDERLAAPETESALLEAGRAEFLKRAGSGDRARAAEAALTRCLQRSRRD